MKTIMLQCFFLFQYIEHELHQSERKWPGRTEAAHPFLEHCYLHLHLHLVIWQTLLSKATYNWGIHKAIHLEEAIRQRKCS